MLQIPDGSTILNHVTTSCRWAQNIGDKVIVTTPDRLIFDWVAREGLCEATYYSGERDPLREFFNAATAFKLDHIVRITADCPLISPKMITEMIEHYMAYPAQKLLIYNTSPGDMELDGQDVEIFPYSYLKLAHENATAPDDREHVTTWMRKNLPSMQIKMPYEGQTLSVNTLEDYLKVCEIIENQ